MVVEKRDDFILDCSSSGIPRPEITWKHNDQDLRENSKVKLDPSGFLKLSNAVGKDSGTYTCKVESIAGKLSRSIKVVVRGILFFHLCYYFSCLLIFTVFSHVCLFSILTEDQTNVSH